jgi:predicted phage baseplate assembly protein
VLWTQVEDIGTAGPHDRVYQLKLDEDGASRIVLGDGVHGSRAPTGAENVVADYRVGIGASGSVKAGQVVLLPRRPVGVREVLNPTPSREWAPEDTLEEARTNAPQRVRTLERAVSVADHEDVARAFPGVGAARADLVWDGRRDRIVLSILGTGAQAPSRSLKDDLKDHLVTMRDPGSPFVVRPGEQTWFAVRVELVHDPAYLRDDVVAAVRAALAAAFGPEHRQFATAVSRADVLLVVHDVPGVLACTMPRILRLPPGQSPPPPPATAPVPADPSSPDEVLVALPARSSAPATAEETPVLLPAELLGLAPGAVEIREMQR